MKTVVLSLLVLCSIPSSLYAYMDKCCLDQCFATGHDCDYCRYMCQKDPSTPPINYDLAPCSPCDLYQSANCCGN